MEKAKMTPTITFLGMTPAIFLLLVALSTIFSALTAWRFKSTAVSNLNFGLAALFAVFAVLSISGRGVSINGQAIGTADANLNTIGTLIFIGSAIALFSSAIAIYRKLKS
jgi:hypothetical protein